MSEQHPAELAYNFLLKAELKGHEVPAFNKAASWLVEVINQNQEALKQQNEKEEGPIRPTPDITS